MPTILNVDDSEDDVLLLRSACRLAKVSFGFQSVKDGDAAIAYLRGQGVYSDRKEYPVPDLVLLDLKMPVMSGFEVLAWIRSQPRLRDLPVIIFTASVHELDRERARQLGATEFLVKTASVAQLKRLALALDAFVGQAEPALERRTNG